MNTDKEHGHDGKPVRREMLGMQHESRSIRRVPGTEQGRAEGLLHGLHEADTDDPGRTEGDAAAGPEAGGGGPAGRTEEQAWQDAQYDVMRDRAIAEGRCGHRAIDRRYGWARPEREESY